jgi:hypothetical protein
VEDWSTYERFCDRRVALRAAMLADGLEGSPA